MFGFTRSVMGAVVIGVLVLAAVAWVLGDDLIPWMRAAQTGAHHKFNEMVDQYEMELEKAKRAGRQAKQRAAELQSAEHRAAAKVQSLNRAVELARKELTAARAEIASLEGRLSRGEEIRFVSGRLAIPAELKVIVAAKADRIKLAEEKIDYLEGFLARRQAMLRKLHGAAAQTPVAIARLERSIDGLQRKVVLYRDMRALAEEEEDTEVALTGMFENAQKTLEEAHAKVDGKLFELEAMLEIDAELTPIGGTPDVTADDVLADIRTALGEPSVAWDEEISALAENY